MQKVDIGSKMSNSKESISVGVLQGSILGVILFLVYMNDIHRSTDMFSVMYADDISGLISGKNIEELEIRSNLEIKKLALWYRANKMSVHPKKSKFILFNPFFRQPPPTISLYLDNNEPRETDPSKISSIKQISTKNENIQERSVRVLGVLLDDKLSMEYHVLAVKAKVARSVYGLSRVKNILPYSSLKLIYYANIHSHLNYCNIFLTLANNKYVKMLKVLQKRAVRALYKEGSRATSNPLFLQSKILRLEDLIQANVLSFMHKFIHKRQPIAFNSTWISRYSTLSTNYTLRNGDDFHIPRFQFEYLRKHPLFNFPHLWNSFKLDFKIFSDENKFQKFLRDYFLHKLHPDYNDNCACQICEEKYVHDDQSFSIDNYI